MNQRQQVCSFINDMIDGSYVCAVPGDGDIEWRQIKEGTGYPITKKRAFRLLVQAGYNPQKLLEFAIEKAAGEANG